MCHMLDSLMCNVSDSPVDHRSGGVIQSIPVSRCTKLYAGLVCGDVLWQQLCLKSACSQVSPSAVSHLTLIMVGAGDFTT